MPVAALVNAYSVHCSACFLRTIFPIDVKGRIAGGESFPTFPGRGRLLVLTFYCGNDHGKFEGSKSWWGQFTNFLQWWIGPWMALPNHGIAGRRYALTFNGSSKKSRSHAD